MVRIDDDDGERSVWHQIEALDGKKSWPAKVLQMFQPRVTYQSHNETANPKWARTTATAAVSSAFRMMDSGVNMTRYVNSCGGLWYYVAGQGLLLGPNKCI